MGSEIIRIESERVLLREWQSSDLEPWIALNLDPDNLRYFPRTYTAQESTESFRRISELLEKNHYGLWAAEEKTSREFMGFIGLAKQDLPEISFMPCHEIGWRLDKKYWGKGYATEGTKVALAYGLTELEIPTIYSYTSFYNLPSINVMKKIGLRQRQELTFEHPRIEVGSPLRTHIVYST
jgi:ribosomal-protein-alanine N-acetyltransferase